jgi:hypothetical protein
MVALPDDFQKYLKKYKNNFVVNFDKRYIKYYDNKVKNNPSVRKRLGGYYRYNANEYNQIDTDHCEGVTINVNIYEEYDDESNDDDNENNNENNDDNNDNENNDDDDDDDDDDNENNDDDNDDNENNDDDNDDIILPNELTEMYYLTTDGSYKYKTIELLNEQKKTNKCCFVFKKNKVIIGYTEYASTKFDIVIYLGEGKQYGSVWIDQDTSLYKGEMSYTKCTDTFSEFFNIVKEHKEHKNLSIDFYPFLKSKCNNDFF